MNIYQPYTYLVGWSRLDRWYYGCQYGKNRAKSQNLWTTYFTSSDVVADMRVRHGEPDVVEVRRVFKTGTQALRCEAKVLAKVNAAKSDRWLNRVTTGERFRVRERPWNKGLTKATDPRVAANAAAISIGSKGSPKSGTVWNKGLTKDTDPRLVAIGVKISAAKLGKPHRKRVISPP